MNKHIQETSLVSLLQKYIDNRCNENELRILLHWLKSESPKDEFNQLSSSLWQEIDTQTDYPDEERKKELNREVDLLLQKIKQRKEKRQKSGILHHKSWIIRIVAIFILLLGLGTGYLLMREGEAAPITYTEIIALRGEIKEYTLDDGTEIFLNSDSKLRIPSDYNQNERSIEIEGEGFFDVTSNPQKPFVIHCGGKQVKVIGTSFNVKSYEEDNYFEVTVSTGKVLVDIDSMDIRLRVTPMEHLSINKQTGNLSKLTLEENYYTRWINGLLYFNRQPIQEVIKTINRKYDRTIILDCPGCHHIISGTHDNISIEAVVDAICFTTGLKQRTEKDNIILYK